LNADAPKLAVGQGFEFSIGTDSPMTERKLVIFCSAGDAIRLRPPSGLLYAALYAGFGMVSPFLPTLLQAHGLTPDEFGLALALSTVVRLVSACRPSRRRELNHNDTMPVDGSGPSGWHGSRSTNWEGVGKEMRKYARSGIFFAEFLVG
jgi:hypothetical protein